MQARILVVEDDPFTQDVLRNALSRHGYGVDVASNGLTARRMVRDGDFDLALLDYRLPDIDGVASARLFKDEAGTSSPKLIGVTADASTMQARAADETLFHAVLQKPFDVPNLLALVAKALDEPKRRAAFETSRWIWREHGLEDCPRAIVVPAPDRRQRELLGHFFRLDSAGPVDIVILADPSACLEWRDARTGLLPTVDVAGSTGDAADTAFSAADRASWTNLARTIRSFAGRRARLADPDLLRGDPADLLLARLFVSGREMRPVPDPGAPRCLRYPGFGEADLARAETLVARGLLERLFVDRLHDCPACLSRRLTVREECPHCRSGDLAETTLIHHFGCAHQAPEGDFRRGADLVCPKCAKHLRHYGCDYDKPGHLLSCGGCGASAAEPAVGFRCLDCGERTDGDAIGTSDAFSYRLSEAAIGYLTAPRIGSTPLIDLDLLALARDGRTAMDDMAVATLRYGRRAEIETRRGATVFEALRRLFLESLRTALTTHGRIVTAEGTDYLILDGVDPDGADELLTSLLAETGALLAEDMQPGFALLPRRRAD